MQTRDEVTVVKLGGNFPLGAALEEVASMARDGERVVLVHGGGAEVDRLAARLGISGRKIVSPDGTSSRRTDGDAIELLTMALAGKVKPSLVSSLRRRGALAVGLTGADGALISAECKGPLRSVEGRRVRLIYDDLSGRITDVRTEVLHALLDAGVIPVVSPPAARDDGQLLNVDADHMAAVVAVALRAAALVLLTDVPGVLRDPADPSSRIQELAEVPPAVTGRMRQKVRAALRARSAVRQVVIASGLVVRPIETALRGGGTAVTQVRELV